MKNKKRRVELNVVVVAVVDNLQELYQQWHEQDEGGLFVYTLSFFDVKTLLQKQKVNKSWQKRCKETIYAKCGVNGPKAFQSKQELRNAVEQYCMHEAASMEKLLVLTDIQLTNGMFLKYKTCQRCSGDCTHSMNTSGHGMYPMLRT